MELWPKLLQVFKIVRVPVIGKFWLLSFPNLERSSNSVILTVLHSAYLLNSLSRNAVATQVAEELHGVTCYRATTCLATFLLHTTLHEVELSSTFCNDCSNFQSLLQCNTPPATCLAMLCSNSQSGFLLSSPQSYMVTGLRVAGSPIAQYNTPVHAAAMLRF